MRPTILSLLLGAAVLGGCHVAKDPEVALGGGAPPVVPAAGLFVESRSGNNAALDLAVVSSTSSDPRAVLLERGDTAASGFDGVVVRINGGESYNAVARSVDQFGTRALVYRKGGPLFKVLLKPGGGNPAAASLSSEALASPLGAGALRAQSYRGNEAVIAYNGPNAIERYVFLSMDGASQPRPAPEFNGRRGRMITGINNQTTGELEGFLFQDDQRIYRTDLNFGNPQVVLEPAGAIAPSVNTGRAFYFVNNTGLLHRYDLVGAHAVAPAIAIVGTVRSLQFDAANVYAFVERTNITSRAVVKIPDQSSPRAVDLLVNLTDSPPRLTPDFVVARNATGFIANRKDRDGTSNATTFLPGVAALLPFDNASSNRVFYDDGAVSGIASAAVDVNNDVPERLTGLKRIIVAAPVSVLGAKVMLPIGDIGITRLLVAGNAGSGRIDRRFQWIAAESGAVQFDLSAVPGAPALQVEAPSLPEFVAGAGTFVLDQNGVRTAFRVRESSDPVVRIPNP